MANPVTTARYQSLVAVFRQRLLEMLKEVAPRVMRVAVINNPDHVSSPGYLRVIETVAQSLGVQLTNAPVRHFSEIERIIDDFAREPNGGMIVLPDFLLTGHRG